MRANRAYCALASNAAFASSFSRHFFASGLSSSAAAAGSAGVLVAFVSFDAVIAVSFVAIAGGRRQTGRAPVFGHGRDARPTLPSGRGLVGVETRSTCSLQRTGIRAVPARRLPV